MKRLFIYSLCLSALLYSCSGEETPKASQEENVPEKTSESADGITPENTPQEPKDENWDNIAILEGGFRLTMKIPSSKVANSNSETKYHEDRGELEVTVGNGFDLFLLEDQSQIEMVKNELNDHAFYDVFYDVVSDSTLLYRQTTSSGEKEQWHIYAERNIGPSKIIIRSNKAISFSEYQAKLMLESALSITPFN